MVSCHQRDEWTEFVRQRAGQLQGYVIQRFWEATVRRWVRVCGMIAFGCFCATTVALFTVAMSYEFRKHEVVPWKHRAVRLDGQPAYVLFGGGALNDGAKIPLTEEQFQAYQENHEEGRRWGTRAVLYLALVMPLILLLRLWNAKPA